MTDKELLELAAKAVGIKNPIADSFPGMDVRYGLNLAIWDDDEGEYWNPLESDGDAFRLAVKLRIRHERHIQHPYVAAFAMEVVGRFEEPEGDDPYAATRRAIVSAAAEIGRRML